MKKLLKQLTEAFGPSGYEDNIRKLVLAEVKPLADEIKVDALGNLIARKKPGKVTKDTKKIMIAAHMDEIGIMVSHIDDHGFVRFTSIGGVFGGSTDFRQVGSDVAGAGDVNGDGIKGEIDDIKAIVHDGAAKHGGSPLMTPWPMLNPAQLQAVAEYVKSLGA